MTGPVLTVTEINHVVLHVADLRRSHSFYVDVLGFEDRTPTMNPGQAAAQRQTMSFLHAGSQGLDLFEVPGGDAHGGEEMNHMALSVTARDIDEVSAALARVGIEASEQTPRNSLFIRDPDGHLIEILPVSARVRAVE